MADIFANNLPTLFAKKSQEASEQNLAVGSAVERVVATVNSADDALSTVLKTNAVDTQQTFDTTEEILGNVQRIRANPFSELIGLFDDDSNIGVQQTRLQKQNVGLQRINAKNQNAREAHGLALDSAKRELTVAQTQAEITQKELGNLTTAANLQIVAMNAEAAQRKRTLQGETIETLSAAVDNPDLLVNLGSGITEGDVRTAILEKSAAAANSRLLGFQLQAAKSKATQANIAEVTTTTEAMLRTAMSDEQLAQFKIETEKAGGVFKTEVPVTVQPGVVVPAGTNITTNMIESIMTERSLAEEKASEQRVAQLTAIAGNQAIIDSSQASMIRAQSHATGGAQTNALVTTNLPPEVAQKVESASAMIELSAKVGSSLDAFKLQTAAAEKYKEANDAVTKAMTESVPKEQKPAMTSFLQFGSVQNPSASTPVTELTLLNPNSISNKYFQSAAAMIAPEANKLQIAMSEGIEIPGLEGLGFSGTKTRKLDSAAFVHQSITNTASREGVSHPADTMMSFAFMDFNSIVVRQLAAENPQLWDGLVSQSGAYNVGFNDIGQVSLPNFYQVLDQRTREAKEKGVMEPTDSMFDILFTKYQEALPQFLPNLLPATMQDAAFINDLAGNNQQQMFTDFVAATIIDNQIGVQANAEAAVAANVTEQFQTGSPGEKVGLGRVQRSEAIQRALDSQLQGTVNDIASKFQQVQ